MSAARLMLLKVLFAVADEGGSATTACIQGAVSGAGAEEGAVQKAVLVQQPPTTMASAWGLRKWHSGGILQQALQMGQ
jgi:hypothetical protein